MNIKEFLEATGESRRNISFLRAENILPPPSDGRALAQYGSEHLAAIRRYQMLRQKGYRPCQIKLMMSSETSLIRVPVARGINLEISTQMDFGNLDVGSLVQQITGVIESFCISATTQQENSDAT